jgi:hypothetical protein
LSTITARSPLPSSVAACDAGGRDMNNKAINTDMNFNAGSSLSVQHEIDHPVKYRSSIIVITL